MNITIRAKHVSLVMQPSPTAVLDGLQLTVDEIQPAHAGQRFEISSDGTTVTDHKTGLMWARDELPKQTYADAEKAVAELRLGGFSDWRLPERDELISIVDLERHEPAIDTAVFNSAASWVWTRTPTAWSSDRVWFVYFGNGHVGSSRRDYSALARAVRAAAPAGQ